MRLGGRAFWRDMHAVTGFWVAGLTLVLLFTGLPWADAWGNAFKAVRTEMGWVKGQQDWTIGGKAPDDEHGQHGRPMSHTMPAFDAPMFDAITAIAGREHLIFRS
jgi:uncharacterized iron-regulated membrane protein